MEEGRIDNTACQAVRDQTSVAREVIAGDGDLIRNCGVSAATAAADKIAVLVNEMETVMKRWPDFLAFATDYFIPVK